MIKRLNVVLTKRILKWLDDESKKDPQKYLKFWEEYGTFLREGLVTEWEYKEDIAKLLRFESSNTKEGELTSFEEYLSRMTENQNEIYYLIAPNRHLAENSPYFDAFKSQGKEVNFLKNKKYLFFFKGIIFI